MLKTILSISGRPGLFKLVSQGKNLLVVESLLDGRRTAAHGRDKIISLGDVSIYTAEDNDVPLSEVFESIKVKNDGKEVDVKALGNESQIREYFGEILPDYDRDRVYTADIRKVFQWYNLLVKAGITDFVKAQEEATETETEEK